MQYPPFPRYPVIPRSKYSTQHHVLKHPQLPFLPHCQRPSFTPMALTSYGFSPSCYSAEHHMRQYTVLFSWWWGIMMPETCWDRSLTINIRLVASCWFLSLHPTFMMHGHKSIKLSIHLQYFGLLCGKFVKKKSLFIRNFCFFNFWGKKLSLIENAW